MENFIETCFNISKIVTALFAAGVTVWKLYSRIKNTNRIFIFNTSSPIPDLEEGRTKNVLRDIEISKLVQKNGLPYMEEATRDKIFSLHELVKYKMTYEQVASANRFVNIDNNNKFVIEIGKLDKQFADWLIYLLMGICFLMFGFTFYLISNHHLIVLKEGIFLIGQSILVGYILYMILKGSLPIYNAETLIKLSKDKDFIYTKEKQER